MRTMKGNLRLAVATLGLLAGGTAFGQTLSATSITPAPAATAQSVQFNYTTGGSVSVIITNINRTDANNILQNVVYQQFNNATSAFVNCDGVARTASLAPFVRIQCTAGGRYTITSDDAANAIGTFANLARAQFDIAAGATDGQTATFSFAPNCAAGQFPNVDNCTEFTNTSAARVNGTLNSGTVTVTVAATPRTLAFNPNFGTTISFAAGGNAGAAAPTQNIVVTSTGNSGTPTVTGCAITGAQAGQFSVNPTSLTGFDTTPSQNLVVGCTYAAAAATATLTCNENDADTAGTARTWTLSCPAGAVVPVNPTITANPPSNSTITISGTVGTTGTSLIDFSAAGGAGTGSTTINCTSTGTVLLALSPGTPSGTTANQTVTGAAAPQDVIVGVPLTSTAQTPAGTVTCAVTPNGGVTTNFTYTINANAGAAVVAVVVPATDLWSKIALFGLLAGLGVLVIGFRRQH